MLRPASRGRASGGGWPAPPAPLPAERTLPPGSPGQVSLPTFHTEATLPPSSQRRNQDRQKPGRGDAAKGVCLLSIHSPHGVQCPPECLALRPKGGPSPSEARKLGWKPPGRPQILSNLKLIYQKYCKKHLQNLSPPTSPFLLRAHSSHPQRKCSKAENCASCFAFPVAQRTLAHATEPSLPMTEAPQVLDCGQVRRVCAESL